MSWIEIVIIAVIFSYSAWMLVRHFKKSKQGACASCAVKSKCKACELMNQASMPHSSDTNPKHQ
ncbi:FeoB-associated Cys-rich membrane protein [Paenibacillus aquistagni]|uniref:Virus attachment protein p12 family protein n=1 Tax=Paenibacillus aquistagni TaxID=1852522 RepID=A0A1X7JW82_9BACL|nr:FeoB-associated Cys-rich membrane protein [Paenibacillus aquistagni]NMM54891.1 FeoB-associated Cys-rich membrane protein [Paenibacillus aquistagni]SMG32696.1 Virus attachment protein p12 family protein [Paenibacillus aquistagni]